MELHGFLYGIYPYLAMTVFVVGSWLRFDLAPYTWKSGSSQFLGGRYFRLASNLFHIGILAIFLGHLVGLTVPAEVFDAFGISPLMHQVIAINAGAFFGLMCLVGGTMLLLRRLFHPKVRAAGTFMDAFILIWLLATLLLGLSTLPVSIHHALEGDASAMLALAAWVQSVLTLRADPSLIEGVETVFKVHIFFGMTVFLLFPFSRLVHIWSAPVWYLLRAFQVVRTRT